jgi:hypothetical protein
MATRTILSGDDVVCSISTYHLPLEGCMVIEQVPTVPQSIEESAEKPVIQIVWRCYGFIVTSNYDLKTEKHHQSWCRLGWFHACDRYN